MNLAEAKEKFYPEYKYALVRVKSNKPHSLYVDRKTAEEERCNLWKCCGTALIVVDLSEVEKMKHQKEWHTCDRCGAEIKFKPRQQLQYVPCGTYSEPVARFTEDEISCELYKTRFCGKLKKTYELCPKCRKDFERFMRNE